MKSIICTTFLTLLASLSFASEIKLTNGGSTTDTAGNIISCRAEKKAYCICQYTTIKIKHYNDRAFPYFGHYLTLVDFNQKTILSDEKDSSKSCLDELKTRPECK